MNTYKYIRWFNELGMADVPRVGGKNAALGEMHCQLAAEGVRVPAGFAITAEAYRHVLGQADAWPALQRALDGLQASDPEDLARRAQRARDIVSEAPLPPDLVDEIRRSYAELREKCGENLSVAVRSSATAEDLPHVSFAGQHETFLNVTGEARLLDAFRMCLASLFKDRAISYRVDNGFDHFKVYQSVGVMKMVRSDLAASGMMFTLDPETGFRDVVFITGVYGLGENVVQGTVEPDEFYVHKPTFAEGHRAVLRRKLGHKEVCMVYAKAAGRDTTRNVPTPLDEQRRYCIGDERVLELADAAMRIEAHYSRLAGHAVPMEIEWAQDGLDGKLYIVQARPESVASRWPLGRIDEYRVAAKAPLLANGRAVGGKIAAGRARVVRDVAQLSEFRPGEVLVADTTLPDWDTVMKSAAAMVTNRGGHTCHAALVGRELGIPVVVGCEQATSSIRTGDEITVSCAEGAQGRVYAGAVPFTRTSTGLASLARPRTHLMVNLDDPDTAFQTSLLPNDGVGLARMEFIVAEHIKAHPMALLHPERIDHPSVRDELERLTRGHARAADYFVRQLAEGVGTIAAAFYPKPVIVRMSDFKSHEYARLLGGRWFEPAEANPMMGFRGAARYTHPAYAEAFGLECDAMRRVRDGMGLVNVKLIIPFCRRVEEGERVLAAMAEHGLARGTNGLEIYVTCEIPNNVLQVDAYARLFDGYSIGLNDLAQLVLGVDRDSDIVGFEFDECDEGVKSVIRQAVESARRNGRHASICDAPTDSAEMAEYLVELGIDSMSVAPEMLLPITRRVLAAERRLGIGARKG